MTSNLRINTISNTRGEDIWRAFFEFAGYKQPVCSNVTTANTHTPTHTMCVPMLRSSLGGAECTTRANLPILRWSWPDFKRSLPAAIDVGEERCPIKERCLPLTSGVFLPPVKGCYPGFFFHFAFSAPHLSAEPWQPNSPQSSLIGLKV